MHQHAHTELYIYGYTSILRPWTLVSMHAYSHTFISTATAPQGAHTMVPICPHVLILRLVSHPAQACSLIDEPVTDLAGQEDVWM